MATSSTNSSNTGMNSKSINSGGENNNLMDLCQLFTCVPNPFNTTTQLSYYLNSTVIHAEIRVYDVQGIERKILNLNSNQGSSYVILEGSDLPIGGIYIYALFVNNQIIDAKTLIKQ